MTDREELALGNPPATPDGLARFPRWTLKTDRTVYRAHDRNLGPWWFASAPGGRWDLPAPEGTCYLADSAAGALRERLGPRVASRKTITAVELDGAAVSRLQVPTPRRLADLCSGRAAEYGVTREIHVTVPYTLTQAWALALRATAAQGIRYETRLSTRGRAYALFGDAGSRAWPDDPAPRTGSDVAADAGITVVRPPRVVRITRPPIV